MKAELGNENSRTQSLETSSSTSTQWSSQFERKSAKATLHDITGTQIDLVKGWDVADFLDLDFGRTEIDALLELAAPKDFSKGDTKNSPPSKPTSDSPNALDGMELWRTPQDETYATLRRDGHFEHWPTESRTFRRHLAHAHFQTEGKAPSATTLEDRRRMLEGEALFGGEADFAKLEPAEC